jgi:hypothetical protein
VPEHGEWLKFARLIDDTLGLARIFVEEIRDLQKHIGDLVREAGPFSPNYAVLDCETDIILNSRGERQFEAFDGNMGFAKVVSLGKIYRTNQPRKRYKSGVVSDGPIFLDLSPIMEVYVFRDYSDWADQVYSKTSELVNIVGS